jgi:hypothetical protein
MEDKKTMTPNHVEEAFPGSIKNAMAGMGLCGLKIIRSVTVPIAVFFFLLLLLHSAAFGQNIVEEWLAVKAPPAPELKVVTIDPKSSALLMLDFNHRDIAFDLRCKGHKDNS